MKHVILRCMVGGIPDFLASFRFPWCVIFLYAATKSLVARFLSLAKKMGTPF